MNLHFQKLGAGEPLIILHGVFGTGDNWITIARKLAETYSVYLIDQRNHGKSPHSDTFSYEAMANDVVDFLHAENITSAYILGHSMGGKVAMTLAMSNPELIQKLIVVDIAPKANKMDEQLFLINVMQNIAVNEMESRTQVDDAMAAFIPDAGVRQFLLKSLVRAETGFEWRFNLPVMAKSIQNIGGDIPIEGTFTKPTLFIKGEKSGYIQSADIPRIKNLFPNAEVVTIPDAGHWVHAEQPEAIISQIRFFLHQ